MGAAATARNCGVSPLLIGLTVVSLGTSAPELLVSAMAARSGNPALCIGNAIGSNITNIALVLGIAALITPMAIHPKIIRRELPLLIGATLLAGALMIDGDLSRLDGAVLLICFVSLLLWIVVEGLRDRSAAVNDDEIPQDLSNAKAIGWLVFGLVVLLVSSRGLVWGAIGIARHFEVNELIIGLTIVAFGTSLPELAATATAAHKNENELAIGNIVGSNLFNILGVLCLPGLIAPRRLFPEMMTRDYPVMLMVTVLLFVFAAMSKKVSRLHGALFVAIFLGYLGWLYLQSQ